MKKGISAPMLAIALGIIFIVIVLLVFGVPLKDYVSKQFETGPFKPVEKDVTYIAGTVGGQQRDSSQCSPMFRLDGSADANAAEIAKLAFNCFAEVRNSRADKQFCACIISENHDIPRELIETHLAKYGKAKGEDPVEALIASWTAGYQSREPLLEKGWTYRICADADTWPNDDDLMITGRENCDAID